MLPTSLFYTPVGYPRRGWHAIDRRVPGMAQAGSQRQPSLYSQIIGSPSPATPDTP